MVRYSWEVALLFSAQNDWSFAFQNGLPFTRDRRIWDGSTKEIWHYSILVREAAIVLFTSCLLGSSAESLLHCSETILQYCNSVSN